MIAIVDYGLGNVRAFLNVFKQLNVAATSARTIGELSQATKILLPGVGAFDDAMTRLHQSGMKDALDELVRTRRLPLLGVCVGMQMLASGSDEGSMGGLGWIDGYVRALRSWEPSKNLPIPHMGWNEVCPTAESPLFRSLESDTRFYFLHSYFFECKNPADSIATSTYGGAFTAAVGSANIFGVQFHPEKSHHFGIQLLKNFAEL